jgi:subtilisin family serine protease
MPKVILRVPPERERRAAQRLSGRYVLTFAKGAHDAALQQLEASGGTAAKPLAADAQSARALDKGHYILLPNLAVAVVDPIDAAHEDRIHATAAREDWVIALEPERIVSAVTTEPLGTYLQGWQDAIAALSAKLAPRSHATAEALENPSVTWGLLATRVTGDLATGSGIKIAILDSGLDLSHPDFANRQIITRNFVGDGTPFHDGLGHGTHCTGTAAGPSAPGRGPRYGIASAAQILAGRVLDDNGRGGDANILQGMEWALDQGCDIISMSLGAPWVPGDPPYSTAYETAIQQALSSGCLVVVAAGNEADDPRYVGAVGTPGNSPSALTVAAVDENLATASFSDRATPDAPGVKGPDLAGPGVSVYSAWPVAKGSYNTISGTSMATPHVAGIAALLAETNPGTRGQALKTLVLGTCKALTNEASRQGEIGRGLVQTASG